MKILFTTQGSQKNNSAAVVQLSEGVTQQELEKLDKMATIMGSKDRLQTILQAFKDLSIDATVLKIGRYFDFENEVVDIKYNFKD